MDNFHDVIEAIKSRVEAVDFIGQRVKLKKVGRNWVGLCPFHDDSKPSFTVFPETQSYYCFGCGKGGDVFRFLQDHEKIDLKGAVNRLAQLSGQSAMFRFDTKEMEAWARVREALKDSVEFYHSCLNPDAFHYIEAKRGLSPQLIKRMKLGYAKGGLNDALLKKGYPSEACLKAGVVKADGRDYFLHRIIIPYLKNREVVQIRGRLFPDEIISPAKYLPLPGPVRLYNEDALRFQNIVLTEGEFDCLSLLDKGFDAIGVPGVNAFKEEWVAGFKGKDVFIAFDNDHDPAKGQAGALKVARLFHKAGIQSRIVILPREKFEEKVDINEYFAVQGHKAEDFQALLDASQTLIDLQISLVPTHLERAKLDSALEPIMEDILSSSPLSQDHYIDVLSEKFKVAKGTLKAILQSKSKKQPEKGTTEIKPLPVLLTENFQEFTPAQCFVKDIAYVTVPRLARLENKVISCPYVITSEREYFPLKEEELQKRGLFTIKELIIDECRWSEKSIKAYLENDASVNPFEVFSRIKEQFRFYIDFKDQRDATLLALVAIGTYFHQLFSSFPYIFLNGTKQCGKTKASELITSLAFNGIMSVSITGAYLFRQIDSHHSTFALDESEQLEFKNLAEDYRNMLLSGYKKGAKAHRIERVNERHMRFSYDIYSPKIISNVGGIEDILGDRCITVYLVRSKNPAIANREIRYDDQRLRSIRDDLYVLALTHHRQLGQIYSEVTSNGLLGREWELWKPIYALARLVEESGQGNLADEIRTLSQDKQRKKQDFSQEQSEHTLVLNLVIDFLEDHFGVPLQEIQQAELTVVKRELFEYIKVHEPEEFADFKPGKLGRLLNTLQIITKRDTTVRSAEGQKILAAYGLSIIGVKDAKDRLMGQSAPPPESSSPGQ